MTPKRVCLTCKNKGCTAHCRFDKPAPLPRKLAAITTMKAGAAH